MGSIRYIAPSFTPEAKEAQQALYPTIERGLAGGGLTPGIDEAARTDMLRRLGTGFTETRRDLGSFISRTIPRADVGVRSFLKKSLDAQFAREKESIGREFEFRGFEDIEPSQNLAFGALSSEKGVASNRADILNQSTMRRAGSPDFGSQLASGLGKAAGIYLAGRGRSFPPSNLSGVDFIPPSPFDIEIPSGPLGYARGVSRYA